VHPYVVHEVSVLHRFDGGGTWNTVPVMLPEDDYRVPTLLDRPPCSGRT
jgi:hypothetical protein